MVHTTSCWTICGIIWTKQTPRHVFNNSVRLQLFCSPLYFLMKSLSVLKPYNVSHTKSCKLEPLSANLQGPCLVVSQTHQLVRRIKTINSSVLKTFTLVKSCSRVAQKNKLSCSKLLVLKKVAQNAKSCSKVAKHNLDMPTPTQIIWEYPSPRTLLQTNQSRYQGPLTFRKVRESWARG